MSSDYGSVNLELHLSTALSEWLNLLLTMLYAVTATYVFYLLLMLVYAVSIAYVLKRK